MLVPQLQDDWATHRDAPLRLFPGHQLSLLLFPGCRPLRQTVPLSVQFSGLDTLTPLSGLSAKGLLHSVTGVMPVIHYFIKKVTNPDRKTGFCLQPVLSC
jgi:hypothetical protein